MKNTRKMMAFLIGITLLTISPAYADHDRAVTTEQMPRQAQEFIARYFPGEKIAYAKKESDFFEVIYEVMFTNGSKVEFRRNGAWKEVDCRYSSLPAGIVSMPIETKVQELYPGAAVIKIERDKQEVEVKLNNGMELTFDRSHNMVRRSDCRSASFFLHRKDRLWCAAEFKNARTEAGMITRKSLD